MLIDVTSITEWNEIVFEVKEVRKVNGIASTSWWFQINCFSTVAECRNLHEVEANINLVAQLKERLEAT